MRLSWLSFALLWASRPAAAAADYVQSIGADAVPAVLGSLPLRPGVDGIQRYFLPGSGRMPRFPRFLKLTGGLSLQAIKEELYFGLADPFKAQRAKDLMRKLAEADERPGLFLELDLRSGWQRDELAGKVRMLTDYYPGGVRKKGEVVYDRLGRRVLERSLDERGWLIFERRWIFDRPGFAPKSMVVLDSSGVTASSVTWTLDGQGLPFDEQHRDSQGLSVLRRSYRHDAAGRLVSFRGNLGERLRGILYEYDYDRRGRLKERRAYSYSTLEPVWVTQFDTDFESGRVVERREIMDRLPLRGDSVTGSGFDPRRELKYRWRFSADQADFYWKPWDGEGNEAFFDAQRRYKIHPKGWLNERLSLDKDSQTLSREFWDWDWRGPLLRYELWGGPGQGAEFVRFDYEFDEQGNWTVMRQFGATEPRERKLEYYQD